jgi:hypothetical protein
MKARAALAAPTALLAALLAGCGIPTTGVVEAGEPAAGVHQDVTLYFVRADDGALVTVRRRVDARVDAELAVDLLVKGVGIAEERTLGLATDVPPTSAAVRTRGGTVTVDLQVPADQLSRTAVDQLVCTVLANADADADATADATAPADADPPQVGVTAQGTPVPWHGSADGCASAASPWPVKPETPTAPAVGPVIGG